MCGNILQKNWLKYIYNLQMHFNVTLIVSTQNWTNEYFHVTYKQTNIAQIKKII